MRKIICLIGLLFLCISCSKDDVIPREFIEFDIITVNLNSQTKVLTLVWRKPVNIHVDELHYDVFINDEKVVADYQPLESVQNSGAVYQVEVGNLDEGIFSGEESITITLKAKDLIKKGVKEISRFYSSFKNIDIDYGEINVALFEESGAIIIDSVYGPNQTFKFSIDKYSKFNFKVDDLNGEFLLYSITEDKYLSQNGALGGGRRYVTFYNSDGLNYNDELNAGEYTIQLRGLRSTIGGGDYTLHIEDIDDQKPYVDLGVLQLPYNTTFEPITERIRNTEYEFEILEVTNATLFVDYNNGCDPYSNFDVKLFNSNEGVFEGRKNLQLTPGKYKLSIDAKTTLILSDPIINDVDFGVLSDFPTNVTLNIDLTYESDLQQKFYFEVLEEVTLAGSFYLLDIYVMNGSEWEQSDWSPTVNTFPPGKYYIVYQANYETYDPSGGGGCEQEYRIVKEDMDLLFDTN